MGAPLDKRLLLVSGKGGVGKSTVAAALASASAQAGLKTLVAEVNTQERVTRLLGKPEAGPELKLIDENLWAVNVRPEEAMREYALMTLKFKTVYKAVFENRFVRYFLRFIPSLQELVLLGKILYHVQERDPSGKPRFDRVIIDAPATGHAISFFSVPQVLVDTVPAGPMSAEAEKMRDLLVDPAVTAAVLVSLPEEMPINETIELERTLREQLRIRTGAVILNGFIPSRFTPSELTQIATAAPALSPLALSHDAREKLSADTLRRLETVIDAPVQPVVRLYQKTFGPTSIADVAGQLQPLLRGTR